jgi:hypothetical protein
MWRLYLGEAGVAARVAADAQESPGAMLHGGVEAVDVEVPVLDVGLVEGGWSGCAGVDGSPESSPPALNALVLAQLVR